MLRSAADAGLRSTLLVASGDHLPVVFRRRTDLATIRSPRLRSINSTWARAEVGIAGRRLLWRAYKVAPQPLQRRVADVRRRRRHAAGRDHVLGREWSDGERAWIDEQLRALDAPVVVYDSPFTLTAGPPWARRLVLAPDLVHERAASLTAAGYRPIPVVDSRWEAGRLAGADGVVTIQWDDAATLRSLVPGLDVVVAPPAFDVSLLSHEDGATGRCLFVGSGALHNVDGLRWFIARVWPRVRAQVASAQLDVVGTVSSQIGGGVPGVRLLGEVAHLADAYRDAQVVVVPLRAGSGLKVKLAEAICAGRPAVTTSVGAQGLGDLEPRPFVVADDADAFADATAELLSCRDRRARLRSAARTGAARFRSPLAHHDLIERLACRRP